MKLAMLLARLQFNLELSTLTTDQLVIVRDEMRRIKASRQHRQYTIHIDEHGRRWLIDMQVGRMACAGASLLLL